MLQVMNCTKKKTVDLISLIISEDCSLILFNTILDVGKMVRMRVQKCPCDSDSW